MCTWPPITSFSASGVPMIALPGGEFTMGSERGNEDEAPPHRVRVSAFLMDQFEVTHELFTKAQLPNPSHWQDSPKKPVERVRWRDAKQYCNERSLLEGLQPCYDEKTPELDGNFDANGYRLPTEAEWEYACRAGTTTPYFFGATPAKAGDYAWFDKNAGGHPRPVGEKQPNPWGLLDMTGNVWQWCNDFYAVDYYGKSPAQDPTGPATGQNKVLRGGAWRFSVDNVRSGYRYNEHPGSADVCFGYDIYGFRCVRRAR